MLTDAKHEENQFSDNARQDHAHAAAEQAGDEKEQADERIERHGDERTDCTGEPK